jgi:hypothetical protein
MQQAGAVLLGWLGRGVVVKLFGARGKGEHQAARQEHREAALQRTRRHCR